MSRQQLYGSFVLIFMALVIKKYYDLQRNYDIVLNSCMEKLEKVQNGVLEHVETSVPGKQKVLKTTTVQTVQTSKSRNRLQESGTSIVCRKENSDLNICHFKNLCYSTSNSEFIIFISDRSIMMNNENLEEFSFSSVRQHNFHYHSFVELPANVSTEFNISFIESRTLIFNRFKPDNIMHVFHDDIIPLHSTLKSIDFSNSDIQDPYNIQLLFMEDVFDSASEFDFLYNLFSTFTVLKKNELKSKGDVICFKDAHTGLSKSTLWYQYGFFSPQGPIEGITTKNINIRDTLNYIIHNIQLQVDPPSKEYIILLSRKENRKILNEGDLIVSVARKTGMRILTISFETHTLVEMIELVSNCRGLFGMHGSLLILALFLRPGCFVVELFPYAVNPSNYTPFKTLAGMKNMNLVYQTWRNKHKENTVPHPDFSPEMGGISHLSVEEQIGIEYQEDIPTHLCCMDPSWLYHIYQDTIVDNEEVSELISESLNQAKPHMCNEQSPLFVVRAGQVRNISCERTFKSHEESSLTVSWNNPGNLKFLNYTKISFEVLLQAVEDEEDTKLHVVSHTQCTIANLDTSVEYLIWVRCGIDGQMSSYSKAITC